MRVGVLALQGDFERHARALSARNATSLLIKRREELQAVDALVLPGGESTTLLRLMDEEFRSALQQCIREGTPTLATCAGLILLASKVSNPEQPGLGCLDIAVARNAYGRQVDSFVAPRLEWNLREARDLMAARGWDSLELTPIEGVFIRAPKIVATGPAVTTLIEHQGDPALVIQENVLGATFHPELSEHASSLYELFFHMVRSAR